MHKYSSFASRFVLPAVVAVASFGPGMAMAQTTPDPVTYTPVIDTAQFTGLVQTNGGKAWLAAAGLGLGFFVARKLYSWTLGKA